MIGVKVTQIMVFAIIIRQNRSMIKYRYLYYLYYVTEISEHFAMEVLFLKKEVSSESSNLIVKLFEPF